MTRVPLGPFALGLALLGAGCGGEPKSAAPKPKLPPIEACKLLTFEEADPGGADSLYRAKSEVDVSTGDDFAKCMYSTMELPPRSVTIELRRFATDSKAKGAQSATVDYLPRLARAEAEVVSGVGDEAAWVGGNLNQLHVRDRALRLIVTVEVGEPETRRDRAAQVARRALERMHAPSPPAPAANPAPAASAAPG